MLQTYSPINPIAKRFIPIPKNNNSDKNKTEENIFIFKTDSIPSIITASILNPVNKAPRIAVKWIGTGV